MWRGSEASHTGEGGPLLYSPKILRQLSVSRQRGIVLLPLRWLLGMSELMAELCHRSQHWEEEEKEEGEEEEEE